MIPLDWTEGKRVHELIRSIKGLPGPRRTRLLAVAFCDRVAHLLPDDASRERIEIARRFADKKARRTEMDEAHEAVRLAYAHRNRTQDLHACAALRVLLGILDPTSRSYAHFVAHDAADAMSHNRISQPPDSPTFGELDPLAVAAESAAQLRLLRDVLGRPDGIAPAEVRDWLGWHSGLVPKLARSIYDDRAFDRTPVLGDALEDAGCTNDDVLTHCRRPGPHTRGCWVVDLLLGLS
jgi:hypothetical protein